MTLDSNSSVKYRVVRPLGKGGMGEVCLAHDLRLDRLVALKFLSGSGDQDESQKKRFIREAKAAAALDHPYICKIYETGEIEGKTYIAMEYVAGITLHERLLEGPLTYSDTLRISTEIAEALEEAHGKGFVHRDLKPANIMLSSQGHAKVLDFGLAKRIDLPGDLSVGEETRTDELTKAGALLGTLKYMSPEQARGEPVDARSDIFSFGVILHEMITGRHPFLRSNPVDTLSAIMRDPVPSLLGPGSDVSEELSRIVQKCLAKDREERYSSMIEMLADLQSLQMRPVVEKFRFDIRGPWVVAAGLLLAFLLPAAGWLLLREGAERPLPAPRTAVTVLIADFRNQTGDPVFDGALEQILGIGLEGDAYITVFKRGLARDQASRLDPAAGGRLDERLARLVCRSQGIKLAIAGSIERVGSGYAIKVRAFDSVSTETVAEAEEVIREKTDLLRAADKLTLRLRSILGDSDTTSLEALASETFTTASLEAMHAYAQAQELDSVGREDEAIAEYLSAVEKDPEFGRAYAGLAVINANRGQRKEAEKYLKMAFAHIDRMTEREKLRTQGIYYLAAKNGTKAIEELQTLVQKYPADSAGHSNLALAYYYTRNMTKALEQGRRAVEMYPQRIPPRFNLAWYAMAAGELQMAIEEADKVLQVNPGFLKAYIVKALSHLADGRAAEATQVYRDLEKVSALGQSYAAMGLGDLALYDGRLDVAAQILEEGIAHDVSIQDNAAASHKWVTLAHTRLTLGNRSAALAAADRALEGSRDESVLYLAAKVYLVGGQETKARELVSELRARLDPDPEIFASLIEGEILMMRGDPRGAIKSFSQALTVADSWLVRFVLGRAYLEAGAFVQAYGELTNCLRRRGEATSVFLNDLPSYHVLPPVYYYLGRAQEGLNSPDAVDSYGKYLAVKTSASKDILSDDIRRRLARLSQQ